MAKTQTIEPEVRIALAAVAMHGILAGRMGRIGPEDSRQLAESAVGFADAMIEALSPPAAQASK